MNTPHWTGGHEGACSFTGVEDAVSLAAAALGIGICVSQHHVRIILADPATYASPLHHRCGLVMLASVGWALFEMGRSALAY